MVTIISFVSSIEILKEFCIENYSFLSLRVEIKLFCMWILFIFKENIFWIDALCKVKHYKILIQKLWDFNQLYTDE